MARNKTLTDRLNSLHSERLAAVDVFTKSAQILEETAAAYAFLADQARVEAEVHHATAEQAQRSSLDSMDKARKIRELVG